MICCCVVVLKITMFGCCLDEQESDVTDNFYQTPEFLSSYVKSVFIIISKLNKNYTVRDM